MATPTPNLHLNKPALSDRVADTIGTDIPSAFDILDSSPAIHEIRMFNADVNPNTIWPGTTWTQLHDVFLVASGSRFAAGSTGGTTEHYHVIPIGFDGNQIFLHHAGGNPAYGSETLVDNVYTMQYTTSTKGDLRQSFTSKVSNLPPYKAVYMWERTA